MKAVKDFFGFLLALLIVFGWIIIQGVSLGLVGLLITSIPIPYLFGAFWLFIFITLIGYKLEQGKNQ